MFTVNSLASSGLTYDYNSGKWYYGSTQLDIKKTGNIFYVPDNYTPSNGSLDSIYDSLKGKYWTVSLQSETRDSCYDGDWVAHGDDKFYFAVFAYRKDDTNWYWVSSTKLKSYYLDINCTTTVPLSLMLVENEDKEANVGTSNPKKDYILTFGTPVGETTYTATYTTYVEQNGSWVEVTNTVTEQGYAAAVLSILGRIDDIPMKAVTSVPDNNMVGAVSGYRITETLYVTMSGIAVMIDTLTTINGKAFSAKFDGEEYHSDYLNATQLGRVSVYNPLGMDDEGYIIYTDADGYVYRLIGTSFVYTGTKEGVENITGDSAIAIIRDGFFLDANVDGDGYITGYTTSGGASLPQAEALQVFQLGGAGLFRDTNGNVYFFENGQMLCKLDGVSDISGADTKAWLLANADYVYTAPNGETYVFSRDLTELDALKLIYGVDAANPEYTDADGNVYLLVGNNLMYQGAPATLTITPDDALTTLWSMVIGYIMDGKVYLFDNSDEEMTGSDAAYLLYDLVTSVEFGEYFKVDDTEDRYVADVDGNLVYDGTALPSDLEPEYTSVPTGYTVLTTDGDGDPLTVSVDGYIYHVTYTITPDDPDTEEDEYSKVISSAEYTGKRTGVSDISASTMITEVENTASRLYDSADFTKYFPVDFTGAEALELLYPTTNGEYIDADGYIYDKITGSLVYSHERVGVISAIYGADVRDMLLDEYDSYHYNGSYFEWFLTEAQALGIYYDIVNGVYETGDDIYRLDGSTLVYIGSRTDIAPADTSAYKALQTQKDGDGFIVGYTYEGEAVTPAIALKLFKLLGEGAFKDELGNVYLFVDGQIVRAEAGSLLPDITGESAVEWLLSSADGYVYVRNGVEYTYDDTLTARDALFILYDLVLEADGEWYYTNAEGDIYKLVGSDLVYYYTPALVYNITDADALLTLNGLIIGYIDGEKKIYLDEYGALSDMAIAGFLFTQDGSYYVDENGNRYESTAVTTSEGDTYYVLMYVDTPLDLPQLSSADGLTAVTIEGDSRELYVDAEGHLYEKQTGDVYVYTGSIYAEDDTYLTTEYLFDVLEQQIKDSFDRIYDNNGSEGTFAAAEQDLAHALELVYGVTASNPYYTNPEGYILELNTAGDVLVYSGRMEGVEPLTISGADARDWLISNCDFFTAVGRHFEVTPVVDPVSGEQTGEFEFSGSFADALRIVYNMGTADVYVDMNGNVYEIDGDNLVYVGTYYHVDDLTGAEALQWIYHVVNGVYTDDEQNTFLLINGNLLYSGTPVVRQDITGDEFDAIYYAYKAVQNTSAAFEMTTAKQVWLERLTDVIAKDVEGRYYYFNGSSWNLQSNVVHTQADGTRTVDVLGEDGITVVDTITQTIRTITDTITHTGGTTLVQRIYVWNTDQSEWTLDSVMIRLPNLTKVYSDGTVEPASEDTLTMHIVTTQGVVYNIYYIEATLGNISVTMHDPAGSLLDGNGDLLNLVAGGDIDFFLRTTGSVGTPDKFLDVSAGGKLTVYDITGELGLISSSMYIFVPASAGSITLEENTRIINGATYHIETENGDILGNRVEVIAGNLILDAHSNGSDPLITGAIVIDTLIVRYDPDQDAIPEDAKVYASTANLDAMGDIDIRLFTASDGSTVWLTSTGGGLTSESWDADDSEVTADVFGDFAIGAFTATNGSVVSLTSSTGGLTSDTWDATDSDVTASVFGDYDIGALRATGSTVSLTSSNGGLTSNTWDIDSSDVTADVFGDIGIGAFTAANGSTVSLTSSNGALTSETWGVTDSDVTASVFGDISIGTLTSTDSTISLASSNGGLFSDLWIADGSEISAFVHGEIEITQATWNDSLVRLDSTDGGLTADTWGIHGGTVYINVYSDIAIGSAEIRGASVYLYSKAGGLTMDALDVGSVWDARVYGDIIIPVITATDSDVVLMSTEHDVLFNSLVASGSNISLLAYGRLALFDETQGHPLISFAKDDMPASASLTLRAANGGIGSDEHRLLIDIPAEITVRINEVTYYYINAVDLPLASSPFYAIFGGYDGTGEDALYLSGVYLKYSDEQFFNVLLNAETPEELAAWIAERRIRPDVSG